MNTNIPFRVGLTGGIGSGKSTVATLIRERGVPVFDADALARTVTGVGGAALPAIYARFGPLSINAAGAMDRDYIRQRIFQDAVERRALEAIVHPWVRQLIDEQTQACQAPWVLLDLPLLCESQGWRHGLRWVWVVDCDEETQIQRVMARNAWPREQVMAVMKHQCTRQQRLGIADAVIPNEGVDFADLAESVRSVLTRFGL